MPIIFPECVYISRQCDQVSFLLYIVYFVSDLDSVVDEKDMLT